MDKKEEEKLIDQLAEQVAKLLLKQVQLEDKVSQQKRVNKIKKLDKHGKQSN